MKAIHNTRPNPTINNIVVLYPKDTEKWKQFTTLRTGDNPEYALFCIPKILKNESNSQPCSLMVFYMVVVLYPKDTEKWKQFTTSIFIFLFFVVLFCIPKILKNESNSQLAHKPRNTKPCCFVSQRYWKMKAIHNLF